jgi:cytochrome c553
LTRISGLYILGAYQVIDVTLHRLLMCTNLASVSLHVAAEASSIPLAPRAKIMKLVKLKLLAVLIVTSSCLAVIVACQAPPPSSGSASLQSGAPTPGGTKPHAVYIDIRALPESSTTMPDKPLILANDSKDEKWGPHKPDAPFDHVKHTTDVKHSLDGKTVTACVECHHTEQPSAPARQEYLKRFERKEVLTAKQLEDSKQAVRSCRACHLQEGDEKDDLPPKGVIYPKKMGRPPSGKLTNDVAYHTNCITCHNEAKKRDPNLKAPETCVECHVKNKP